MSGTETSVVDPLVPQCWEGEVPWMGPVPAHPRDAGFDWDLWRPSCHLELLVESLEPILSSFCDVCQLAST